MITQDLVQFPVISYKELRPNSVDEFLEIFEDVLDLDIESGMDLDFVIDSKLGSEKVSPTLVLAKPEDAKTIADICKEVYDGTYPYKEIEDELMVKKMIFRGSSLLSVVINRSLTTRGEKNIVL